nr:hypothetical protein [uncultured Adlercreutzia sp.]
MAKAAEEVSDLSRAAGGVDLSSGLVRQTVGIDDIVDGQAMTTSEALDLALSYLGPGYKDMGNGRYVSADGLRQFRMGTNDMEGVIGTLPTSISKYTLRTQENQVN